MRRAARLFPVAVLGVARIASAEPWTMTMEAGAEADSNVERVQTGPMLMTERIAAPVGRAGGRIDHRDHLFGGAYAFGASALARMVASSKTLPENVMLYAGEARWMHGIEAR